jgi:tellurite resistance protein TerC
VRMETIGVASWCAFLVLVMALLALDLGVINRKAHVIKIKEAIIWSVVWILIALLFNLLIYYWLGGRSAMEFLTGYVLERSLSMDNIFVFIVIFNYFKVPERYHHKVLFWGIFGALVMRALFILAGITLLNMFHQVMYIFGIFLVITGLKLAFEKDKEVQPEKNPVLKLLRRFLPVTENYVEGKFTVRKAGRLFATPMLVVLIVMETTDVVFALDSIPAILAITQNVFIVFTSNVFAILGLRALYFALAGMMQIFEYLNYGLSVILVFIGAKMLISGYYEIPIGIALGVVAGILAISVVASMIFPKKDRKTKG